MLQGIGDFAALDGPSSQVLPEKEEMVRPRNILSKAAKGCKIFWGTLARTERMRKVRWVDSIPADCRTWTCQGRWVLQPARRQGGNGRR